MEPLVWLGVYGLELLFFAATPLWRFRRLIAALLLVGVVASTVWLLWLDQNEWFYIVLPFTVFRAFNHLRIIKSRMHTMYLRHATTHTAAVLAIMTGLAIAFTVPLVAWYLHYLPVLQILVAAIVLLVTVKNIRKLRFKMPKTYLVDRELPTVTVAIPARNEAKDLEECLDSVLACDYPKLEILVLDDCSQDKTAEVIRSYAHAGVRFVQGEPPADRWLAKNQAYHKLYQEASGDLMLFMGVDVRLGRHTIRNMVNVLHDRGKSMLSVLPRRHHSSWGALFVQPMRYWWELALPRRLFNRPPALSTCWLISRKQLKKLGGFAAVSHTLLPEGYFARELIKADKYGFIRSSSDLQVHTVKSLSAQRQTALRTMYPLIRRRPENALFLTLFNIIFLLGPFVAFAAGFWVDGVNMIAAGLACILLIATHVCIIAASDPANILEAMLTFPLAVIIHTGLGWASMLGYEFFTINWKDRNICVPAMHVIPKAEFLNSQKPEKVTASLG